MRGARKGTTRYIRNRPLEKPRADAHGGSRVDFERDLIEHAGLARSLGHAPKSCDPCDPLPGSVRSNNRSHASALAALNNRLV